MKLTEAYVAFSGILTDKNIQSAIKTVFNSDYESVSVYGFYDAISEAVKDFQSSQIQLISSYESFRKLIYDFLCSPIPAKRLSAEKTLLEGFGELGDHEGYLDVTGLPRPKDDEPINSVGEFVGAVLHSDSVELRYVILR